MMGGIPNNNYPKANAMGKPLGKQQQFISQAQPVVQV